MHGALGILCAALLVDCAAPRKAAAVTPAGAEGALVYRLEAREVYDAGEPVRLTFVLDNRSTRAAWVLKWYTPLEGLKGRIFTVTRDGQALDYQGPLFKRGEPRRDDYARLAAGARLTAEVDLSSVYDLAAPGEYRVEFAGRLHDVAWDEGALPRPRDAHEGLEIAGQGVRFRVRRP